MQKIARCGMNWFSNMRKEGFYWFKRGPSSSPDILEYVGGIVYVIGRDQEVNIISFMNMNPQIAFQGPINPMDHFVIDNKLV